MHTHIYAHTLIHVCVCVCGYTPCVGDSGNEEKKWTSHMWLGDHLLSGKIIAATFDTSAFVEPGWTCTSGPRMLMFRDMYPLSVFSREVLPGMEST